MSGELELKSFRRADTALLLGILKGGNRLVELASIELCHRGHAGKVIFILEHRNV